MILWFLRNLSFLLVWYDPWPSNNSKWYAFCYLRAEYFSKCLIDYKDIQLFVYLVSTVIIAISLLKSWLNHSANCWILPKISIGKISLPISLIHSIIVRDSQLSGYLEYILYWISIKITQSSQLMPMQNFILLKFHLFASNMPNSSTTALYTSKYPINSRIMHVFSNYSYKFLRNFNQFFLSGSPMFDPIFFNLRWLLSRIHTHSQKWVCIAFYYI